MPEAGIKSLLGYSRNSPYQNDPYIDIFTPEGLVDMSNTDKDLVGVDEYGNKKKMKARTKNPYKFEGQMVREIPMQTGGPFNDLYSYLFDDDEDNQPKQDAPTAPSTDELDEREAQLTRREQALQSQQQDDLAMQIANEEFSQGNPYARQMRRGSEQRQFDDEGNPLEAPMGVNPYVLQTQNDLMSQFNLGSKGIWGDASHQQRISDHNTGDAEDFSFDNPATATASINKLMNEAKERNVKYIIYNGQIWNPSISPEWRPYNGKNPHTEHFHVSYNR